MSERVFERANRHYGAFELNWCTARRRQRIDHVAMVHQ